MAKEIKEWRQDNNWTASDDGLVYGCDGDAVCECYENTGMLNTRIIEATERAERIAKLPELEAEVEKLRAQLAGTLPPDVVMLSKYTDDIQAMGDTAAQYKADAVAAMQLLTEARKLLRAGLADMTPLARGRWNLLARAFLDGDTKDTE